MTTPVGQEAVDSSRASVGELLADISSDLSTLMRQEMDLAKAEIRESASRAGILAAAASRVSSSRFRFGRGVVGAGRFHRPRLVRTRRRRHLVDHRRRTRARRPVGVKSVTGLSRTKNVKKIRMQPGEEEQQ